MRLGQVFPGPPGDPVWRAGAYERWEEFIDAVDRQPAAPAATRLLIQAGPLAANLEERADTGVSSGALTNGGRERLIFAGQQAAGGSGALAGAPGRAHHQCDVPFLGGVRWHQPGQPRSRKSIPGGMLLSMR